MSNYHGIGKVTALKTANKKIRIPSIGEIDQPMQAIITEGTLFISSCYGAPASSMTKCRHMVWGKKSGKSFSTTPDMASLPCTSEGFIPKIYRGVYRLPTGKVP